MSQDAKSLINIYEDAKEEQNRKSRTRKNSFEVPGRESNKNNKSLVRQKKKDGASKTISRNNSLYSKDGQFQNSFEASNYDMSVVAMVENNNEYAE